MYPAKFPRWEMMTKDRWDATMLHKHHKFLQSENVDPNKKRKKQRSTMSGYGYPGNPGNQGNGGYIPPNQGNGMYQGLPNVASPPQLNHHLNLLTRSLPHPSQVGMDMLNPQLAAAAALQANAQVNATNALLQHLAAANTNPTTNGQPANGAAVGQNAGQPATAITPARGVDPTNVTAPDYSGLVNNFEKNKIQKKFVPFEDRVSNLENYLMSQQESDRLEKRAQETFEQEEQALDENDPNYEANKNAMEFRYQSVLNSIIDKREFDQAAFRKGAGFVDVPENLFQGHHSRKPGRKTPVEIKFNDESFYFRVNYYETYCDPKVMKQLIPPSEHAQKEAEKSYDAYLQADNLNKSRAGKTKRKASQHGRSKYDVGKK